MAAWTDLPPDRSDPASHEKARWFQAAFVLGLTLALALGAAACALPIVQAFEKSATLIAACLSGAG